MSWVSQRWILRATRSDSPSRLRLGGKNVLVSVTQLWVTLMWEQIRILSDTQKTKHGLERRNVFLIARLCSWKPLCTKSRNAGRSAAGRPLRGQQPWQRLHQKHSSMRSRSWGGGCQAACRGSSSCMRAVAALKTGFSGVHEEEHQSKISWYEATRRSADQTPDTQLLTSSGTKKNSEQPAGKHSSHITDDLKHMPPPVLCCVFQFLQLKIHFVSHFTKFLILASH